MCFSGCREKVGMSISGCGVGLGAGTCFSGTVMKGGMSMAGWGVGMGAGNCFCGSGIRVWDVYQWDWKG